MKTTIELSDSQYNTKRFGIKPENTQNTLSFGDGVNEPLILNMNMNIMCLSMLGTV